MTQNPQTAIDIPIDRIRPDPKQPRHLFPSDLTSALAGGSAPRQVLAQLRERGKRMKWIRVRLDELDALADSIAADGLMQPIRVIECADAAYVIEEGERRWWAHHILVARGKRRFEIMPAFIVEKQAQDSGLLRRRVAENVLRSGFTVIEMARALDTRGNEIASEEPHMALLNLSEEVQDLAQQVRLSENALRKLVAIKGPTRQIAAARALVKNPKQQSRRPIKTGTQKRIGRDRPARRLKPMPRQAITIDEIKQLVALAKVIVRRRVHNAGNELAKMLIKSETDRNPIRFLRDILNRALTKSVRSSKGRHHRKTSGRERRRDSIR